jgi:hypothetical protein
VIVYFLRIIEIRGISLSIDIEETVLRDDCLD